MLVNDYLVVAMFIAFIAFMLTGYPIAFCLAGTAVIFTVAGSLSDLYLGTATGVDFNYFGIAVTRIFNTMSNWVLISLPLFIYMGLMLDKSGMAEKLMMSAQELFGKLRGGLAITVVLIGVVMAASTGIVGASVVMLGLLTIPAMLHQGYNKRLAVGVVAASGTLGILIPPSIMLVVMGDQVGISVGDLFMGAFIPGFILAALYIVYLVIICLVRPEDAPLPKERRPISAAVLKEAMKSIIPPSLLILSVLGSIFAGIATVTEASGVGALFATVLAYVNGKLNRDVLKEVLYTTFKTNAYIFGILIGATCFALVLRGLGGDEFIARMLKALPFGPMGILWFIVFVVFMLGFFLDWIEICFIILPLITPVVAELDFIVNGFGVVSDPKMVWFLLVIAVTLQTSFVTPPVGFSLFYLKGIVPKEITLGDIYRGIIPFVILQMLGVAIIAIWPELVTWLPAMAYRK
jgi:tripartite ATP-independent transporter DctM subunit